MDDKKSEFGKGFVYCLILFACHAERNYRKMDFDPGCSLWFNGASDHLYELKIPTKWKNTKLGKMAQELKDISLERGHGNKMQSVGGKKDFNKAINLLKTIGIEIDKRLGIKPIEGTWQ